MPNDPNWNLMSHSRVSVSFTKIFP